MSDTKNEDRQEIDIEIEAYLDKIEGLEEENEDLIIEENTIYEIDHRCMICYGLVKGKTEIEEIEEIEQNEDETILVER